ncbi:hypothetical protein A2U01_0097143 [Trifolium medium]|uniref:Uncharacterized protein n=1 Tax=Trifolium medium TaxID=97028 RepID=A0A392UTD3_9FABA|nr:hypothetical protein [Trifolium medium]
MKYKWRNGICGVTKAIFEAEPQIWTCDAERGMSSLSESVASARQGFENLLLCLASCSLSEA